MKNKMIKNFLIINCIGKDDKLALRINKDLFICNLDDKNRTNENLVTEILNLFNQHNAVLNESFSVLINQGPGSFTATRIALAVAKGLIISKKVKLYGYRDTDLGRFDKKNIEKLLKSKLNEKKLIKPIYLS